MAVSYGPNVYFDTVRLAIKTELDALKADLDANHVPTLGAVYSTHRETANWTFNAASIGISEVPVVYPFQKGDPVGPIVYYEFAVDIRIHIGYENAYHDEVKVMRLCQSVINWLHEQFNVDDATYPNVFQIVQPPPHVVTTRAEFEDTETIGGLIEFTVRADEKYAAS